FADARTLNGGPKITSGHHSRDCCAPRFMGRNMVKFAGVIAKQGALRAPCDDDQAQPAIAASIAANAALALLPSGPPACAMSGRPPPPLPPSASAPSLTRSTALMRLVRSSVTPTTSDARPSSTVTNATTPEPSFA